MKKISVSDNHSTLMADFFREEEKKLVQKLGDLREVLSQLMGGGSTTGGKRRGRPAKGAKSDAGSAAPKKRGRKPGTKMTKPYTGKKRGPKPKGQDVAGEAPSTAPDSGNNG